MSRIKQNTLFTVLGIQPLCLTHLVNDSSISNVEIVVKFVVDEELLSSCLGELDANNKKSFLRQP